MTPRRGAAVLGSHVDAVDWTTAVNAILDWGHGAQSKTVCLCNVHSAVTAKSDAALATALAGADLVLPDGAPVAWALRRYGFSDQQRIAGPDLMLQVCDASVRKGLTVFLFGSMPDTLDRLKKRLRDRFPALNIVGAVSPPFREMSAHEETKAIETINSSGAAIVFVALGCPRQEKWMAQQRGRVRAVMIGVGAAFDFHAGNIQRAPRWMQRLGLEWLHRLMSEPGRLWKRYTVTNTLFIAGIALEILKRKLGRKVDLDRAP